LGGVKDPQPMQGREGQTAFRLPEQGHRLLWLGRHRVCSRVMQASVGLTAPTPPPTSQVFGLGLNPTTGFPGPPRGRREMGRCFRAFLCRSRSRLNTHARPAVLVFWTTLSFNTAFAQSPGPVTWVLEYCPWPRGGHPAPRFSWSQHEAKLWRSW
jgi:hypothetical protein